MAHILSSSQTDKKQGNLSYPIRSIILMAAFIGATSLIAPTSSIAAAFSPSQHLGQSLGQHSGGVIPGKNLAIQQVKGKSDENPSKLNDKHLQQAHDFLQSVADRGLAFLSNKKLSQDQRKKEFRKLLKDSFDTKIIAQFSIGRYWRKATPAQRDEYLKLFEKMIINIYAGRFDEYSGQKLIITNKRPEGKRDVMVDTKIVSPNGGPDVLVRWRLRYKNSQFKIIDVVIEGVSMIVTQRSDFAATIQKGGGEVEYLLKHLRERTK